MKVEDKIIEILKQNNIPFELMEHEKVYTAQVAAKVANHTLDEGIKSMVLRRKPQKDFILVCIPGSKRLDSKKIMKLVGARKITNPK